MRLSQKVFEAYRTHIECEGESNRAGALAVANAMEHSPLNRDGVLEKTVHIPKVFDAVDVHRFENIVQTSTRIFEKVIAAYRADETVRALFGFSKELEELILLPARYACELPMARMDIFYEQESGAFEFCEINTDGAAAMFRDLELRKALVHNPAHQAVMRQFKLEPFELFDTWVECFMKLYQSYPKHVETPTVAIADFLDNATLSDFEEFERRFQAAGIACAICDVRELRYQNGSLYSAKGERIDAVYRRAVTGDVMAHYDEVQDFLQAVKEDAVFVAGSFATQVIHNKWLFYVLHHPYAATFLNEEELAFVKAHVPQTIEFSAKYISLETVRKNKDEYILKPMDAYASKGVYAAGRECTPEKWEHITAQLYESSYICQKYCKQYMSDNIDYAWGDGKWHPYMNMPGLYAYGGKFSGVLMRMACEENIIVAHKNERTAAVFKVH